MRFVTGTIPATGFDASLWNVTFLPRGVISLDDPMALDVDVEGIALRKVMENETLSHLPIFRIESGISPSKLPAMVLSCRLSAYDDSYRYTMTVKVHS